LALTAFISGRSVVLLRDKELAEALKPEILKGREMVSKVIEKRKALAAASQGIR
jgi:hypothetical protein